MKSWIFRGAIIGCFIVFCSPLMAQLDDEKFYYGFSAGVSSTSINEVSTTLIRPIFPVNTYSVKTERALGFMAGFSIHYRFRKSKFAIQPEILYSDLGGAFSYEDVNDLKYTITFKYNYLAISPTIKYYLANGVFLSIGPQLNLIIDRSRLHYSSNKPEYGPDLQIQQSLREVLKGNSIATFSFGAGYDFPFGLQLKVNYLLGISDSIETLANGFYFIENKNGLSGIQCSVAYHVPFFN